MSHSHKWYQSLHNRPVHCVPKKEAKTDFQNSFTAEKRMKFPMKPRNIFHHTSSMFSHYLGKINTSTFFANYNRKMKKQLLYYKNKTFVVIRSNGDGRIVFTAYAQSVCSSLKNACATRQLHCQWCSGWRYGTLAANTVSVRQCRAPATGT